MTGRWPSNGSTTTAAAAAPDARAQMLRRVRSSVSHAVPHPGRHPPPPLEASWSSFAALLTSVGGEPRGPVSRAELPAVALALARAWANGGRIVAEPSAAALLGNRAPIEVAGAAAAPASFADVAVAIVRGELGVAECGAVAVLGGDAPQRALLFLAERVLLLLDASRIEPDLHSAFRALPREALAGHHVTWISGPSKTADIEQTLVFGAHGPRALAVLGFDGDPAPSQA
jgi:L-lactate dehydrogenase complex protein LldG